MTASAPPLHVCLVTWNHWAATRRCLESLTETLWPGPLHLWITDNASSDDTVAAIRREFPEVRLLENTWNAGFAVAMNQNLASVLAAEEDPSALVLLLNNDTWLAPDTLTSLAEPLLENPTLGIAAPTIFYGEPADTIWYGGGGIDPVACRAWHHHLRAPGPLSGPPIATGYATGCALLVRAAVLRQIGLLDEGYFMYWEDADLSLRAQAAGWGIVQVPAACLWHAVSTSTGGQLAPKKLWRKFASGWKFWSRYHARGDWPLQFIGSALSDYLRAKRRLDS